MQKGKVRRLEYDRVAGRYERHGTTCLMAAQHVANGELMHYNLQATRNEQDFLSFIQGIVAKLTRENDIIILADQLNTHMSASLVEWIARQINCKASLGKKNLNRTEIALQKEGG